MAYAHLENGHITSFNNAGLPDAWFDVYFDNPEFITKPMSEYIIKDGKAYYEPTEEQLKQKLIDELDKTATDDIEAAICELASDLYSFQKEMNEILIKIRTEIDNLGGH